MDWDDQDTPTYLILILILFGMMLDAFYPTDLPTLSTLSKR